MVVLGTNSFSFVFQSSLPSLERIGREKQEENTHTHVSRKKAQVNVAGMLIMNPGPGGCLVAWEIPTLAHVGNTQRAQQPPPPLPNSSFNPACPLSLTHTPDLTKKSYKFRSR